MHSASHLGSPLGTRWFRGVTRFSSGPLRLLARPMVATGGESPRFKPDLTFVHMTDIHLSERQEARLGFEKVLRRINQLRPDFVISGGDQIYDAGFAEHERAVRLFAQYRESVAELNCPVYHVIGNHDHFGHGQPLRYARHEDYGKRVFLDQLGDGQRYRSFGHSGWHFILLDTSHFFDHKFRGHIDREQMQWLRAELRAVGTDTNVVVVTHVPLLTRLNSVVKGRVELRIPKLAVARARRVRRLFNQHNVRLVLQGHTHAVEQLRFRNTWYLNSGAVCGHWWRSASASSPKGFTVVSVKDGQLHWRYEQIRN